MHVELDRRAIKDLKQLSRADRDRIERELSSSFAGKKLADNVDIKPLRGANPWQRLRIGSFRVLLRPLTTTELRSLGQKGKGFLVARIVNRRDLHKAAARLPR